MNRSKEKSESEAMKSALEQIKNQRYATELRDLGVKRIWGIGVVVDKKPVWVESFKC